MAYGINYIKCVEAIIESEEKKQSDAHLIQSDNPIDLVAELLLEARSEIILSRPLNAVEALNVALDIIAGLQKKCL